MILMSLFSERINNKLSLSYWNYAGYEQNSGHCFRNNACKYHNMYHFIAVGVFADAAIK